MISISDIAEEMQADYPKIDNFDIDTFNGNPALAYFAQNSSLFIYVEEEYVNVAFEDDPSGQTEETELVHEIDIADLYQELTSFVNWLILTGKITVDVNEYRKLLTKLAIYELEPDENYTPN